MFYGRGPVRSYGKEIEPSLAHPDLDLLFLKERYSMPSFFQLLRKRYQRIQVPRTRERHHPEVLTWPFS